MKNNNKLTLKALQQELESLKAKSATKASSKATKATHKKSEVAGHDIKNSYINNLHMKSSMFYLWIITGLLGYGRKIPIINTIVTVLNKWYGRTTWWNLLGRLRKMFVVFNALIGVVVVFKTTGFGVDTFWAHFAAMGTEYVTIFKNFVSRLFNWFLNLFDQRIVPNVPNTKPGSPSKSVFDYINSPIDNIKNKTGNILRNPITVDELTNFSLRDLYKHGPLNNQTPWYKDWSTIFWVGGIIGIVGLGYCGYKLFTDPSWIASFSNPTTNNNNNINPGNIQNNQGGDLVGDPSYVQSFINVTKNLGFGIWRTYSGVRTVLNPFYWFATASNLEQQSELFIARQSSLTDAMDNRFYPFTEIHPYRPWYHRIRILVLGESVLENQERLRLRDHILRDATAVTLEDTRSLGSMTPATAVGLGVKQVGMEFTGMLEAVQTWSKIKSVSSTPNVIPNAPLPEFIEGGSSWDTHKIHKSEVAEGAKVESSSEVSSPSVVQTPEGVTGNISPAVSDQASVHSAHSAHSAVENNSNPELETTVETVAAESNETDYFIDPLFAD